VQVQAAIDREEVPCGPAASGWGCERGHCSHCSRLPGNRDQKS
jgi:hypothetical protein